MSEYDLIVIGAGATGLAAARAARRAGKRVALVEKARPGGDCTHYGCVPSKTLLDVAHRVAGAREAQQWGLESVGDVDFGKVMAHVHEVIGRHRAGRVARAAGVGGRRPGRRLGAVHRPAHDRHRRAEARRAPRFVLATGAHAAVPPVPGLDEVDHLDNRTLFDLTERPEHLLVMGGGAIGVELSQAFSALGARVTLVEGAPRILGKEEPEVSAVMTTVLEGGGVQVRVGDEGRARCRRVPRCTSRTARPCPARTCWSPSGGARPRRAWTWTGPGWSWASRARWSRTPTWRPARRTSSPQGTARRRCSSPTSATSRAGSPQRTPSLALGCRASRAAGRRSTTGSCPG